MPLRDAPQASSNVCLPAISHSVDDQDWNDFPMGQKRAWIESVTPASQIWVLSVHCRTGDVWSTSRFSVRPVLPG